MSVACDTANIFSKFMKIALLTFFLFNTIFHLKSQFSPCSSKMTKSRAKVLADEIGSWHLEVSIDGLVSSLLSLFQTLTGKRPRYKVTGA